MTIDEKFLGLVLLMSAACVLVALFFDIFPEFCRDQLESWRENHQKDEYDPEATMKIKLPKTAFDPEATVVLPRLELVVAIEYEPAQTEIHHCKHARA